MNERAALLPAPDVARLLADALEQAAVPYAVGGAIAYGFHGPPRATNDVDLNIFMEPDELGPAVDALAAAGATVDRAKAIESARLRGDFSVHFGAMRVDVFTPSIELSYSAAARTQTFQLLGRPVRVLSAEDLVLFKLLFFRPKDIIDVERLLRFRGADLDRDYVQSWIVRLMGEDDERTIEWRRMSSPTRPA
jgi:Nucleotidyl transferase AbiEii toxin, Type IV TA system